MTAAAFPMTPDETVPIDEACRRLANISRATFYRIKFFQTRRVPVSDGRVGILVSDIALYLHLQGKKQRPARRRR